MISYPHNLSNFMIIITKIVTLVASDETSCEIKFWGKFNLFGKKEGNNFSNIEITQTCFSTHYPSL